jgi:hypothetical protein
MTSTGVILDVDAGAYHADKVDDRPSLNASIAKILLAQSPRHAWWAHPKLNPRFTPSVDAKFDVGTVVHRMVLEPEREQRVVVVEADSWRTKAAQDARGQAREDGHTPLLAGEWERVQEMLAAVRPQLAALDLSPLPFTDGKGERTIVWEDPRTEVLCRARVDWLHDDMTTIDDLKTTKMSANPIDWARRTMWSIDADVQDVFYRRAVEAVTGRAPDLRFIVAESRPPYAVAVVALAESAVTLAEQKVNAALDTWKRCLDADQWPGYPPVLIEAEAPAWSEVDFFERQQLNEEAPA